jgi:hypothetical protein
MLVYILFTHPLVIMLDNELSGLTLGSVLRKVCFEAYAYDVTIILTDTTDILNVINTINT